MCGKVAKAAVAAGLVCLALTGCAVKYGYNNVDAVVSDKQYIEPSMHMMPVYTGKSTILVPENSPAEHDITFSYGKVTSTSNDDVLYNKYKVGDKIPMYLVTGYGSDGKAIYTGLTFDK